MNVLRIESILGGQAPTTHFAAANQFGASLGIDPTSPINDNQSDPLSTLASGLLRPTPAANIASTTLNDMAMWMIANPKDPIVYVYDHTGSIYQLSGNPLETFTGISDTGVLPTSRGNGAEYYDNYMYFANNTSIARLGPLDNYPGSYTLTSNYWVGTLGKTALTDTTYPTDLSGVLGGRSYPSHVMHRHSDGKLYIADVVGNRGTLHYISTTKSSVEGDTDNGSTYSAVQMGYGMWPMAIESYNNELVIALYEGGTTTHNTRQRRAQLAFWDTLSQNINKYVFLEFPDNFISALKNVNGVLYIFSGNLKSSGVRVSRFIGGYTIEEVAYIDHGQAPFAGAVDGVGDYIMFGTNCIRPETAPAVYSVGSLKGKIGQGLFSPVRPTGGNSVTALAFVDNINLQYDFPIVAWSTGTTGTGNHGIDTQQSTYNNSAQVWWSQMYRIGQPFKITKIRIPLAQAVAANMTVTPKIYVDEGTSSTTLTAINNTNYSGQKNIVIRPQNLTGNHNFFLELRWTGSALCVVGLPITIEYELVDD